jgi:hypothetical protein
MIEKLRMWSIESNWGAEPAELRMLWARCGLADLNGSSKRMSGAFRAPDQEKNASTRGEKKARRRVDAPSNKTYGNCCWAFIVATASLPPPAPTLVFSSLQGTNRKIYQQLIHKAVWMSWGQLSGAQLDDKKR